MKKLTENQVNTLMLFTEVVPMTSIDLSAGFSQSEIEDLEISGILEFLPTAGRFVLTSKGVMFLLEEYKSLKVNKAVAEAVAMIEGKNNVTK